MSKYLNKIKLFIAEKNAHSPIFFNHRFFFSNSSSDTQEKLTKIQLPKWTENISLSHNPSNEIETFVNYIENSLNFVNPSGKDTHKLAYALCSPSHFFERDLTLFVISQYIGYLEKKNQNFPGVEILMTTTDSGLKTLRILKEFNISKLNLLVSNNSQEKYGENLKINILKNDLEKKASEKLISLDTNEILIASYLNIFNPKKASPGLRYDIIDLECRNSFDLKKVKNAMYSMKKMGGLICLTFEDSSLLFQKDKCFSIYGMTKVKMSNNDEHTIRLLYYCLNSIAGTIGRVIQPFISVVLKDGSLKLYYEVLKSGIESEKAITRHSQIFKCSFCVNYELNALAILQNKDRYEANKITTKVDKCEYCWNKFNIGGPIWNEFINNYEFVENSLKKLKDPSFDSSHIIQKTNFVCLFQDILEEKKLGNQIFGYNLEDLCKFLQVDYYPDPEIIIQELKRFNYDLVPSYLSKGIWKTNAPKNVIFELFVLWHLQKMSIIKNSAFPKNLSLERFVQTLKASAEKKDFPKNSEVKGANIEETELEIKCLQKKKVTKFLEKLLK